MRSASGAWLFFNFFAFCSCGLGRSSSEVERLVPLTGWVEKDGGGSGLAEGVCCVLLWPLTNGEEPACESLKLPDLFGAGVEKKLAVFDLN